MNPISNKKTKADASHGNDRTGKGGVTHARQEPSDQQAPSSDGRDRSTGRPDGASSEELRLPHEFDQSSDRQATHNPDARKVVKQAHRDVERGLVDTDKGYVADGVKPSHEK